MYLCCAVMECARDGAAVRDKGRGGSGASRGNRRGDRIGLAYITGDLLRRVLRDRMLYLLLILIRVLLVGKY